MGNVTTDWETVCVTTDWETVCKGMWSYLLQELGIYTKREGPVSAAECDYGIAVTQAHLEHLVLLVQKHTTGTAGERGD